jgi:hypothetical protein
MPAENNLKEIKGNSQISNASQYYWFQAANLPKIPSSYKNSLNIGKLSKKIYLCNIKNGVP